jgi:hypothetical protein
MAVEHPLVAKAPRRDCRWVVLVAGDEVGVYSHLRDALRNDPKVQVILDRHENHSRNPEWVNERLRAHEAVVIRIPG